jgi:hypothetical protein
MQQAKFFSDIKEPAGFAALGERFALRERAPC